MDILFQNMTISDQHLTFDPLWCAYVRISPWHFYNIFEEVLAHFTFEMAYMGSLIILLFIRYLVSQNMKIMTKM
jgi:hypothetical protein